ncbi:hypothetical protein B0F90DRAFT_1814894 [Multifurca ochricompacta]|uniref:Uncharacterized protein n=1 Tax=Multifurca ochricompacta TaxID=376703 RepID=A0AAD4MBK9_9AGAM|nr:hypothetical protein B0F90DRAFT_1814894 [Multifurca ochricompacta]
MVATPRPSILLTATLTPRDDSPGKVPSALLIGSPSVMSAIAGGKSHSSARPFGRIDSKETSLDRGYVSVDALCLALEHMNRIRKIRIHSPWGTKYGDRIMNVIYGALCRGAPSLEELDLAPDLPFLVSSGPDRKMMVSLSLLAELRVLRLDQVTHLRLSAARPMWPALEPLLNTLALLPNLQILELYGVLPTGHSSPAPLPIDLSSLKELRLGGTGQSILAVLQALNLSETVQVHVTLPNAVTENGSRSRWLGKLRAKQSTGAEHAHTSH